MKVLVKTMLVLSSSDHSHLRPGRPVLMFAHRFGSGGVGQIPAYRLHHLHPHAIFASCSSDNTTLYYMYVHKVYTCTTYHMYMQRVQINLSPVPSHAPALSACLAVLRPPVRSASSHTTSSSSYKPHRLTARKRHGIT